MSLLGLLPPSFFALLPPEINSALIYSGAGSGSLTSAAAGWQNFAEDLTESAQATMNVIAQLGSSYHGPSYAATAAAVNPFVAWMHATAGQAAVMGQQAATQAGLFETARGGSIPPAAIAANRAELLVLIATNWLGQNAAAIASNEAQYMGYWTTDATAMEAYSHGTQANTAAAQKPTPPSLAAKSFSLPGTDITSKTYPGGTFGSELYTLEEGVLSFLHLSSVSPTTLDLPAWLLTMPSEDTMGLFYVFYPFYFLAMFGTIGLRLLMMGGMGGSLARAGGTSGMGMLASAESGASGPTQLMTQIGDFVDDKLKGAVGVLANHFTTATNGISAKLGQAASMGQLRVPQGWSPAADGMVRAAPVVPHTTVSAPVQTMSAPGLPGGPFGNAMMGALAGRGIGSVAAKAPKIVPRSPSGG